MEEPVCGLKRILIEHAFELSSLLFFILPMSLITVLYVLIGLRLRRSSIMTRESGGSFGHTERGRKGAPPHRHHCSRRVLKMLGFNEMMLFLMKLAANPDEPVDHEQAFLATSFLANIRNDLGEHPPNVLALLEYIDHKTRNDGTERPLQLIEVIPPCQASSRY